MFNQVQHLKSVSVSKAVFKSPVIFVSCWLLSFVQRQDPLLYVRPSLCRLVECCIFNSVKLKTVAQAKQKGSSLVPIAIGMLRVLCACQCACFAALAIKDFAYCLQVMVQLLALCVIQFVLPINLSK